MRVFLLILTALLVANVALAQKQPFQMVKISENLYIDETEITVGSWLSYYTWVLLNQGKEVAKKVLPDSALISNDLWQYINNACSKKSDVHSYQTLQSVGYFYDKCDVAVFGAQSAIIIPKKSCALLVLPITGVSYQQVVDFCIWRTKTVGNGMFEFRLPTPKEWEKSVGVGLSNIGPENIHLDSLCENCPAPFYNYKTHDNNKLACIGVFSRMKNKTYDMLGNVSEMTSEKGVAKGGNYTIFAKQCSINGSQIYERPEKWLGFRCVANPIKADNSQVKTSYDTTMWFKDERDGNMYGIVKIGKQVWMRTNLAYKPNEGKYWAYNNNDKYVRDYGYLYNWETATKVCPVGWHLPSKSEFEELLDFVGGGDLKNAFIELSPLGNSDLSIEFSALRYGTAYTPASDRAAYWTNTEYGKRKKWYLIISKRDENAKLNNYLTNNNGLPIRCIKN